VSNLDLYRIERDHIRENLNKYTRKAFESIPDLDRPSILDIGCGTGVPTIAIAKMSGGHVIGMDIDETSLELLRRKLREEGLNNQVSVIKGSIMTMNFPEESFDIIWSEGSIFVIGFENSLRKWRGFIKPGGFLVIHDENKDRAKKIGLIKTHGYSLITQFELPESIWLNDFYVPLEKLIHKFRHEHPNDIKLNNELGKDKAEIDKCKSHYTTISSFFIIIQKVKM
jgi:ubiquinone/menaquinone biosynthesis C-methylase UbiE